MKKLIALLLTLMLLLSAAAGLAEDPYVPMRSGHFSPNTGPSHLEQTEMNGKLEYDAYYSDRKLQQLEVELVCDKAGVEYEVYYDSLGRVISAEYETPGNEIYYDGVVWTDKDGKITTGPDISFMKKYFYKFSPHGQSYLNNTMGLVGISLRDQFPGLTDKWYNVVPIDLTEEGSWVYPMAVSNKYYMGNCIITVRDGTVTVDYTIPYGRFYVDDQCLAWFTDVKEIDANFLNNPTSNFRFGQPVSIKDDLKGKDIALLFICNHVDYVVPLKRDGARPSRLLRGNPNLRKTVAGYVELLDKMNQ
jgi:hypothetical protein